MQLLASTDACKAAFARLCNVATRCCVESEIMRKVKILLAILISLTLLTYAGPALAEDLFPMIGDVAQIGASGEDFACFDTQDNLDSFMHATEIGDSVGGRQLLATAQAATLHRGTRILVLDKAGDWAYPDLDVRIMSGSNYGTACWLPSRAPHGFYINIRSH
jgi:hypothetical protein